MFVDGVSQLELSIATEESVYAITEALKILDETLSSEAAKASEGRRKLDQILSRLNKLDGDFSVRWAALSFFCRRTHFTSYIG
jgi:hypothetical protein